MSINIVILHLTFSQLQESEDSVIRNEKFEQGGREMKAGLVKNRVLLWPALCKQLTFRAKTFGDFLTASLKASTLSTSMSRSISPTSLQRVRRVSHAELCYSLTDYKNGNGDTKEARLCCLTFQCV